MADDEPKIEAPAGEDAAAPEAVPVSPAPDADATEPTTEPSAAADDAVDPVSAESDATTTAAETEAAGEAGANTPSEPVADEPAEEAAGGEAAAEEASSEEAPVARTVAEEPPADELAADEPAADAPAAAQPAAEAPAAEAPAAPATEPEPVPVKGKRKRLSRALRHKHSKPARERSAKRAPIVRTPKQETTIGRRQERRGVVVSDKGDKSIVVKVETIQAHPKYKKVVRRSRRLQAHDEGNTASVGDVVRIVESRPLSKTKHWRLVEIVERAR